MSRLRSRPGAVQWVLGGLVVVAVAVAGAIVVTSGGDDAVKKAVRPGPRPAPSTPPLRSRPGLRPPPVTVDVAPARPDRRLVLVTPRMEQRARDGASHDQGALALDQRGRTVWFRRAADGEPITELRVQRYRGQPVLTWWEGAASKYGVGRGQAVIVDQSYRTVKTVQAGNGKTADLHEFELTSRGTALVTIYSRERRDLRALGGARNAQVTEGVVQEIDVESGRVLFEWHSLRQVRPSESYREVPKSAADSYDYFHINSVSQDADGNLLVSARHTSAVYKVDRRTGRIIWRLGGKRSDFTMAPGARFSFQHDARRLADGSLRIFDNRAPDAPRRPSSVKVLRLDMRRMRATLVRRFEQPDGMWAESQGNAQSTGDGGVFVGWGSTGAFSWFDARGRVLFDAHLPAEYDTYRARLMRWTGRPAAPPAIAARRERDQVTVWASWNGSTEVRAWQLLAGPSPRRLRPVGRPAQWNGLETAIVGQTKSPFVAVAALGARGGTLRRSKAARVGPAPPPQG